MMTIEALAKLAAHLRHHGFRVTIEQIGDAVRILQWADAGGHGADPDPECMARLLRPIFCKNAEDQTRFAPLLQAWLALQAADRTGVADVTAGMAGTGGAPPVVAPPDPPPAETAIPRPWRLPIWVLPALLLAGVLAVGLAWQYRQAQRFAVLVTSYHGSATAQPRPGAIVSTNRCSVVTDKDGKASCIAYPADFPVTVTARAEEGASSASAFAERAGWRGWLPQPFGKVETLTLLLDTPPKPDDRQTTRVRRVDIEAAIPTPPSLPEPPPPQFDFATWLTSALAAFSLLLLAFALWLRRAATLVRAHTALPAQTRALTGATQIPRLAAQKAMRTLALSLRHTEHRDDGRLHAKKTVEASAKRAGLFAPVFGARRERRFLAFVRRQGAQDHQAFLAEALVRELFASGVDIQAFYFDIDTHVLAPFTPQVRVGQPRTVHAPGARPTMDQVLAANPEAECFVLCQPAALIDPLRADLLPWLRALLRETPRCVVLALAWDGAVELLRRAGAEVASIQPDALLHLARRIGGGAQLATAGAQPVPANGGERFLFTSEYQLYRADPAEAEIQRICIAMHRQLGTAGYKWLQACAVYPEIQWPVTNALGRMLIPDEKQREDLLILLCGMVWFQRAWMPDWLRLALIATLAKTDRQNLHDFYWTLFADSVGGQQIRLDYAHGRAGARPGLWARWRRGLRARRALAASTAGKPGREQIFVQFLLGRRVAPLAMPIPQRILTDVFNLGRLPVARALGTVATLALMLATLLALPRVPVLPTTPPVLAAPKSVSILSDAGAVAPGLKGGQQFRDEMRTGGDTGPLMVVIPPGSFMMGSPASEPGRDDSEGPQHQVNIASAFALGKTTVTFDEWDACVKGGGCGGHAPVDYGWGRGARPVIDVSWDDAQRYVAWLSKQTGKSYRLPTEAEWEYAARAGTTTAYYWGETIGVNHANCDGCGSRWDGKQTAAVGSFAPNGFGLHDMSGNVYQWTQDCWHKDYSGKKPTDGSDLDGSNCSLNGRVLRGGSWYYNPVDLRAANRGNFAATDRIDYVGLRVARTLP